MTTDRGELDLVALIALDGLFERFSARLDGLTDDEYRWEPVPGCWTLEPIGDGRHRAHPQFPTPESPPLTTISWRMCHIGDFLRAERNWVWLGHEPRLRDDDISHPITAAGGVAYVTESRNEWAALVRSMPEQQLWAPLGESAGPYASSSRFGFGIHLVDEFIHHAAEVALMRDLYRVRDSLGR